MLEALDTIEHVGEVARLFLVLTRWGKPKMEEQALIERCKQTGGLSSRYPRPRAAIDIAISAGLLARTNGSIVITDRGQKFASQGTPGALELTNAQSKVLLSAMLDVPEISRVAVVFLCNFQSVRGKMVARRNSIQPERHALLFCRTLQQFGAVAVSGDYYVTCPVFEPLLASMIIQTSKLTQAELMVRLELQRKRGDLAEQKILEMERIRLVGLGRPNLAMQVERVSLQDVSAGYDIRSFEKSGQPRFVEVKSSVGSRIKFEWSLGERATATKHSEAYYIYFVPFSFSLPDLLSPVILLRNPIELIRSERLVETGSNFVVAELYSPSSSLSVM